MLIRIITTGIYDTNAYLLTDDNSSEALLIDAPDGSHNAVREALKGTGKKITAILLTHGHWDHLVDLAAFQKDGATVYAHPDDRQLIENPAMMSAAMPPGIQIEPAKIDKPLADGDRLKWWDQPIEIRHVPGHCPGNILFHFPESGAAFVGDAIFAGSIGRTDLPGASFKQLEQSIREKIYTLPDETVLYPGHGPRTFVVIEKNNNPHVRA